ncbi:MAG TPA: hypothetical protein VGK73_24355 [Polyangiaceae bacterium]
MRTSAACAVLALLGTIGGTARADKPSDREKPAHPESAGKEKSGQPKAGQPGKADQGKPEHAAQPGRPDRAREGGGEGRGKADEAREARGKSAEAHELAPGRNRDDRDQRDARHDAAPGKGDDAARDQTRAKRRTDHRLALKNRYGLELLQRPPIRVELERHAWRVARLERMRVLAEAIQDAAKRGKTLARLDALATKENARHERHMEQLKNPGNTLGAAQPAKPAEPGARHDPPGQGVAQAEGIAQRAEKAGGAR